MNISLLEKDRKTYGIIRRYVNDVRNGVDLLADDNRIQIQEIIQHNDRVHADESLKWINENGEGMRAYLNACKFIALIFFCTKTRITWDKFCFFVDGFDMYKCLIVDKML